VTTARLIPEISLLEIPIHFNKDGRYVQQRHGHGHGRALAGSIDNVPLALSGNQSAAESAAESNSATGQTTRNESNSSSPLELELTSEIKILCFSLSASIVHSLPQRTFR
jgi:hypothetical protein